MTPQVEGRPQCDDPRCPWCAKAFFAWYKARIGAMNRVLEGEAVSFSEAASTSNVPPK